MELLNKLKKSNDSKKTKKATKKDLWQKTEKERLEYYINLLQYNHLKFGKISEFDYVLLDKGHSNIFTYAKETKEGNYLFTLYMDEHKTYEFTYNREMHEMKDISFYNLSLFKNGKREDWERLFNLYTNFIIKTFLKIKEERIMDGFHLIKIADNYKNITDFNKDIKFHFNEIKETSLYIDKHITMLNTEERHLFEYTYTNNTYKLLELYKELPIEIKRSKENDLKNSLELISSKLAKVKKLLKKRQSYYFEKQVNFIKDLEVVSLDEV